MTILRLTFAGQIKKAEWKNAAGKSICELSVCKKNKAKEGEEPTFTWVRVTLWEPADFQTPKLATGNFLAGSGEMTMRSYIDKTGAKGVSCEVSCRSFDVEVAAAGEQAPPVATDPAAAQPKRPAAPAPAASPDDEPPF